MRPLAPSSQRGLLPRVPATAATLQHPSVPSSRCGGLSSSITASSSSSSSSSRRFCQAWAGLRQGPRSFSSSSASRQVASEHAVWGYARCSMPAAAPSCGTASGHCGLQLLVATAGCSRHPRSPVVAAAADATPASSAASQVWLSDSGLDIASSDAASDAASLGSSSSFNSGSQAASNEGSTDGTTTSSSSQQKEARAPRAKPQRRSKQQQEAAAEREALPPETTTIKTSKRQRQFEKETRQQLALLEERRVQQAQRDAGRGSDWQPLQGSAEDDVQEWDEQQGAQAPRSSSSSKEGSAVARGEGGPGYAATKQQQNRKQAPSSSTSTSSEQDYAAMPTPVSSVPLSPLHFDIKDFAAAVVPTRDELTHKKQIIQMVQRCVHSLEVFDRSDVRVAPFGSFVSGLGTWDSDIDLVITGLLEPDRVTGGFAPADKRKVSKLLRQVAMRMRKLKKLNVRTLSVIPHARIPIIKAGTRSGVNVDISLGDGSGPRAANFVRQQMAAYAPLAPLVLTLKVFLRSAGLNEVANGGLSSFSLTNMVLAHLQEDLKAGQDIYDLGESLYGFFCRYGDEFDYDSEAVSVASGGIVRRDALSWAAGDGRLTGDVRLAINDPLTGRDVSAGTYRMSEVRNAFAKAARRLEAMVASSGGGSSSSRVNYLACLFDPVRAVDRRHGSHKGAAVVGGRPGGPQELSFAGADSLMYEELDISGDEDELDDWAQGSWVGNATGRRR